ncbi:hypothetical protein SAMN05444483_101713 [Salegentibacter echinorum]|uniref:Glycosyl transferase family 1 n=1 Tax=Salegentibacter echinorum TaxID=1073325 RepID=A0A1M5CXH2_SALEC|nr:glycosyl transferase family 1 [Salegentibacter echinorum]SHF59396.1 hypothetical protein SAMN05444483_101713 [Salegentibacter echinorum]
MRKVLIITYYWPPAGGPGVQRWLKFVKYLRDFDFEPVVYIPENPTYPMRDISFEKEVPNGIEILKQPIFEPYALAGIFSKKQSKTISKGIIAAEENQSFLQKSMLFIRGNLFIPDARKFWIKPSVKFLKDYLEKTTIDQIITTGPPHSLHLIGLKLKKELKLKWTADFRDPWTQIGYHKKLKLTKKNRQKHKVLELEVLNTADEIITTSFTTKREFSAKTNKPITVITNGFEEENDVDEKVGLDDRFSIAHIGSLLSERNPINLWKSIAEICRESSTFSKDLQLNLAGTVSEEVVASIKAVGLEDHLNLPGYLSHNQALKMQKESRLLLLIEINSLETRGIIPGKLFEYLNSRRPILAVGPDKWDVEQILKETGAGKTFAYNDNKKLKDTILKQYKAFKAKEPNFTNGNIAQYSRKNLTAKLVSVLKK